MLVGDDASDATVATGSTPLGRSACRRASAERQRWGSGRVTRRGPPEPIPDSRRGAGGRPVVRQWGRPVDSSRELVGGDDVVARRGAIFANMRDVLASAGCSFADLVKVTVFLTDIDEVPLVDPCGRRSSARPGPSTLVEVSALVIPVRGSGRRGRADPLRASGPTRSTRA